MRLHFYKTAVPYYEDALMGRKPFEVRKNDRVHPPVEGDVAIFAEVFTPIKLNQVGGLSIPQFTGRRFVAGIGFVLPRYDGIALGYHVFGLRAASIAQIKHAMIHSAEVMPAGLSKKVKPEPKIEVPKL